MRVLVSLLSNPKQLVMSFAYEEGAVTACYESNIHRSEADRLFRDSNYITFSLENF